MSPVSCWILLLLSPAAVGGFATLAAAHSGRRAADSTTTSTTTATVDFAVVGGDGFQPLLPKATAAKTTAQEKKISCWILLLLSPAAVGASLRSQLPIRGGEAPTAQPPAQPPQRWILPSSVGWLPAAVAEGDSRKKKGGGEICACYRTPIPLLAEEILHPWHFDPLTVISPSPRKSPGEAGALSLSPDGVSDPAEGATAQPSEAIPPVAKQGGDAKQGKRERTRRGKRTV